MESRITALESTIQDLQTKSVVSETVHVNRIGNETPQMWIKPMKDLEIHLPPVPPLAPVTDDEEEMVEEVEEEEAEEEVVEVEEEVVEVEEEEEEEAEEEAEEEEAEEVEEFTFKNKKYYKDSANNVYGVDADGELLSEDTIGVWDVQRQRILFKRT
jgi:cobalamin biosynthesis protein CobT